MRSVMPILISTHEKWSHRRNSLKRQRAWHILHEQYWHVIRTELANPALMRIRLNIVGPPKEREMIEESPTPQHWNYFLALESDLSTLSRYLEPTQANFDAYSLELARLLFAAASEVDVVAKQLCRRLSAESSAGRINAYREEITRHHPEIASAQVSIPKFGLSFIPWECWARNENPIWWTAYNKVKHERHDHFSKASLKNALNAVGGLFTLLLFHYSQEARAGELSPDPVLFRVGHPFQVDRLAWGAQTFVYQLPPKPVAAS
jgi:hypothetical protein